MVPRANTWQLWGKKSFLDTSLNWFVTVFVTGMRQYHCILPPLRTSLYFASLQVGVALLMCLVLTPGWRLHGWTSEVYFSHGGQKLPEEQGRNFLGCKLRDVVLCSIWGPYKSYTKSTVQAQRGKLLSWMSGKGKGCLLNSNLVWASLEAQLMKNLPVNAGDADSIPGSGRCPGGGNGNPLQDSCLGDCMDRGVWWAAVHGVTKSQTRLSD